MVIFLYIWSEVIANFPYCFSSENMRLFKSYHIIFKSYQDYFNALEVTQIIILGDPEVTVNLYCNFPCLYWKGCVIFSIYLR